MPSLELERALQSLKGRKEYMAGVHRSESALVDRWQEDEPSRKRAKVVEVWQQDSKKRAVNREFVAALFKQLSSLSLSFEQFSSENPLTKIPYSTALRVDTDTHQVHAKGARPDATEVTLLRADASAWKNKRMLLLFLDQGPKTWPAASFLAWTGCRVHNDVGLAVAGSKLSAIRSQFRVVLKLRAGPYRSGAHHQLLLQSAKLMRATESWQQPLWQWFYADICHEHSMHSEPDYGTQQHERHVWEQVLHRFEHASQLRDVAPSRWFSWESAGLHLVEHIGLSACLYLLTWTGMFRGYWRTWNESPLSGRGIGDSEHSPRENMTAEHKALEEELLADEQPEPGAPAAPATTASSASPATDPTGKQTKQVRNFEVAAHVLSQPLLCRIFRGMLYLSAPIRTWMSSSMTALKSPRGSASLMRDLTSGKLVHVAQAVLATFSSAEYAVASQCVEYTDEQTRLEHMKVALCLYDLVVLMLGELLLTAQEWRDELPGLFFRLLSDDMGERDAAMARLRAMYGSYLTLRQEAILNKDAQRFLVDLRWPAQQLTLE
eukprot:5165129-Amphidinium_carterae.2